MTRHNWVRTVIHWEDKLDHTIKWYLHYPESVAKNETLKILWDFEIQTGSSNLSQTTRPCDSQQQKKENLSKRGLCNLTDQRVKLKEIEKGDKYLDLARELKKTMKHKSDGDTSCNWWIGSSHQRIPTGTRK